MDEQTAIRHAEMLGRSALNNRKQQGLPTEGLSVLELGALCILEGTHWTNNFERLLGTLELQGPKFFAFTYPASDSPITRSITDYPLDELKAGILNKQDSHLKKD